MPPSRKSYSDLEPAHPLGAPRKQPSSLLAASYTDNAGVEAPSPSTLTHLTSRRRRRWLLTAFLAAAVIITIAIVVGVVVGTQRRNTRANTANTRDSKADTLTPSSVEKEEDTAVPALAAVWGGPRNASAMLFSRRAADGRIVATNCTHVAARARAAGGRNRCAARALGFITDAQADTPLAAVGPVDNPTLFYLTKTHRIAAATPRSNRTRLLTLPLPLHARSKLAAASPDGGDTYGVFYQSADSRVHEVSSTGAAGRPFAGASASPGSHLAAAAWRSDGEDGGETFRVYYLTPLTAGGGHLLTGEWRGQGTAWQVGPIAGSRVVFDAPVVGLACSGWEERTSDVPGVRCYFPAANGTAADKGGVPLQVLSFDQGSWPPPGTPPVLLPGVRAAAVGAPVAVGEWWGLEEGAEGFGDAGREEREAMEAHVVYVPVHGGERGAERVAEVLFRGVDRTAWDVGDGYGFAVGG